jgi:RimJ/RimL family protein N-acetyltransferase
MKIRRATIQDADLLLKWRNDPLTRKANHTTHKVQSEEHITWLTKILNNPNWKLMIAEEDGIPVGTVRMDYADGIYELSWTVAPEMRRRGIGKKMVSLVAQQIVSPIRAKIYTSNVASVKIAEYCGMSYDREENDFLYYYRL